MTAVESLKNIGPTSASWLEGVGIHTAADLAEVGVVEAYLRVKRAYPERVSLNLLYALQGALLDIRWNLVPDDMREMLRQQARTMAKDG